MGFSLNTLKLFREEKEDTMRKLLLLCILVFIASILFLACGGGGGGGSSSSGGGGTSASGKVALYATDDMSNYHQVISTINKVQIVNTGTGATCDVLTSPVTLDLTNLSSVLQLLNIASCPSGPYNRIHVEFSKSVTVTDNADKTAPCSFASYKNEHNQPNTLQCSGNICSLDINGAVNVLANQNNKLALDFRLKDFEVNNLTGPNNCTVTMKVSPLTASEMDDKTKNEGYKEAISGGISNLDTTAKTFVITKHDKTFTVDYSGITTQQNIDQLLQFAQDKNLKVQVKVSSMDLDTGTIKASAVYVKIEGAIKQGTLNTTNKTFTLTFASNEITVDYSSAEVEGALADNVKVEVKLMGVQGTKFLASNVEVEMEMGEGMED